MQRASHAALQNESQDVISFITLSKNPFVIHAFLKAYRKTTEYRRLKNTKFAKMDDVDALCFVLTRDGKDTQSIDIETLKKLIEKHQASYPVKIKNALNAMLLSLQYSQAKTLEDQQQYQAALEDTLNQARPAYLNFSGLDLGKIHLSPEKLNGIDFSYCKLSDTFIYQLNLRNIFLIEVDIHKTAATQKQLAHFIPAEILEDENVLKKFLNDIQHNISGQILKLVAKQIGLMILENPCKNKGTLLETLFNHSIHGNTDVVGNRYQKYMNFITDNHFSSFKKLPHLSDSQKTLIPLAKQLFHKATESYDNVIKFLNSV